MSVFGGGGGAGKGLVCFKEEPSKRKSILATKLKKNQEILTLTWRSAY